MVARLGHDCKGREDRLMPSHTDFLRAVLAAPSDDGPRLVYADWLEEHGTTDADRARGEFIRVQFRPGIAFMVPPLSAG